MNDRYRLGGLGDDQLLAAVTALVKRENDSLSDLLAHLAELDERQLCVTLGYSSLFAYCTEALGFSQIFGRAAHRGGADTADGEFRELLDEVRALLSHAEPKGDLLTVMKRGLETLRGELLKKRFGVGRKPRRVQLRKAETRAAPQSLKLRASKRTRHVAAAVAREVYERDRGRCTFCADDGRRCNEQRLLQLDHVIPHAEGGEATAANLRLRCRAHNLLTARAHFGREYVRAAAERAREPCTR